MQRPNVVIANSDPTRSALLAKGLREYANQVVITNSSAELQNAISKNRADVVIADLETMAIENIRQLRSDFGNLNVVCTHRVPDEEMWASSLEAGASDCCASSDVDDVVRAALQRPYKVRRQAA